MLNVVAGAMKRSFASAVASTFLTADRPATLVLAIFQDETYFERERERYGAYGASGTTTIVGFPGARAEPLRGVSGFDTSGRPEFEYSWILVVLGPDLGATLVAKDEGALEPGATLEWGRMFTARWSFRRDKTVDTVRELLGTMRSRLSARELAAAEVALANASERPAGPAEDQLSTAIESLLTGLANVERFDGIPTFVQRDLLTGLPNWRYLDRWLGTRPSAARLVALLIDVDDMGVLNETRGKEAGDAAIVAVARGLEDECLPGELLVRLDDDEFLVLMPLSAAESPSALAERFVVGVRALRLPFPFGSESVSASIGVAVVERGELPLEELRAAVESAKKLGKNRARAVEG